MATTIIYVAFAGYVICLLSLVILKLTEEGRKE